MVQLVQLGAGGVMFAVAKYMNKGGFRLARIVSFLDPWADADGTGWQVIQGLYAIGSRSDFLVLDLEIVLKSIYIYLSHKMTLFSLLLLRNSALWDVRLLSFFLLFLFGEEL